ncbi:hypothetical protein B0A52_01503 [Exophiala mesophila]|uniref:Amino acid permease/ SLC12A domain-containing protein n=1 Tax=Exophiala mesophila TaxID=212818 RepID=A0A438NF60_EXOME|nr:hypothetical protein B0A52_01503 [Exophiala mesophila]
MSKITFVNPPTLFDPTGHNYSHASVTDSPKRIIHTAGQVAIDQNGQIPSTFEAQARLIFSNIKTILAEAGASVKDITMITGFVVDYSSNTVIFELIKEFLTISGTEVHKPPQAVIPVAELAIPGCKLEILVVAAAPANDTVAVAQVMAKRSDLRPDKNPKYLLAQIKSAVHLSMFLPPLATTTNVICLVQKSEFLASAVFYNCKTLLQQQSQALQQTFNRPLYILTEAMMDFELGKKPLTPEEIISVQTTRDNGTLEVPTLAALGLEESHVKRNFNMLSILALGFNICASWVGIAASIAFAIAAGGTVSLLYGLLVVVFFNMCIALSLAELASVYPTAGGQYHFVSILSPKAYARAFSYTCGFSGVAAWIAISSAVTIAVSHGIVTIVLRWHPDFSPTHWQEFLMYQAINIYSFLHNLFLSKRNPLLYDFGFALSLSAFIVITICCPAVAKEHASSSAVWTNFVNSAASWPDGVSFFIGLTTPQFMLLGLDGALHMAEECLEPEKVVPKALIATVGVGGVTAFLFAISMSYCLTDLELVLNSPTG